MTEKRTSFSAGIEFETVLPLLAEQIYETPLAFIRENVQNAVDAVRIQAYRDGALPEDDRYRIDVTVGENSIIVRDNGIGMSASDLRDFFWTIGASGKRTQEALASGCVGTFGIGGFANFGVCETLEVISQIENDTYGTYTRLSKADIDAAGNDIPQVTKDRSDIAAPRGTVVVGRLRTPANVEDLCQYLVSFVRYVPTAIYVNDRKVSQARFVDAENRRNLIEIGSGRLEWQVGDVIVRGRLFEDRGHTLVAMIESLGVGGQTIPLLGQIRFENGSIDVFKHGFKLCATHIGSAIGISGRLDCDRFVPTAGRDSLDATTTSLVGRICLVLERVAIETVLERPERIAQHTRIFQYVIRNGLVNRLGRTKVRFSDGSQATLGEIRNRSEQGVGVFFGIAQKQALNRIMQARGHLVVLLSSDRYRREAERQYLLQYCAAKPFDGMIDCVEPYEKLSRFEKIVLSELELNIKRSYGVEEFSLIPGKLTEDIPVFFKEYIGVRPPDIYVDVRHPEIAKLEYLGFTQILYSLIATFCREYLGQSLKKWSPRFFGDGSLNLQFLASRRSDLWILVRDDIGVVINSGHRQVVTRADVKEVQVGETDGQGEQLNINRKPRILRIVDKNSASRIGGYYIRVPDTAYGAYGDLLPPCETRGVVWAGNKIAFVASDAVSAAFQYEIRVDEIVTADATGTRRAEGAIELTRSLQEMFRGIYFPIPSPLEPFLVPFGDEEIRLHLFCEWIDMRTAQQWLPR